MVIVEHQQISLGKRRILSHTPHHIVQQGHNRQIAFVSDNDYNYYRGNLIEFKHEYKCRIYAYCLMTNHVHLIVDSGDKPESLSMLMKRVAGLQTRYVNELEKPTGSLWEGRFKSSIVSSEEYLPACSPYVEFNPVRAGIVADPVVDFHPFYLPQGDNRQERQKAYVEDVLGAVPEYEIKLIRDALKRGQLTGSEPFRSITEKTRHSSFKYKARTTKKEINLFP